jgi:tryptophan-rich sensory protein
MNATKVLKGEEQIKKRVWTYVISIAVALGVGGLSALLTMGNMDLYSDLRQPPLAPPAILFPIVWTILYILMGISAAMILTDVRVEKSERSAAMMPYAASLFVNFFWSILFFNLRAFLPAFIWLLLLEFLVLMTIFSYRKVNTGAAYLQIPYTLWVAFAGYLNFAIWLLN